MCVASASHRSNGNGHERKKLYCSKARTIPLVYEPVENLPRFGGRHEGGRHHDRDPDRDRDRDPDPDHDPDHDPDRDPDPDRDRDHDRDPDRDQ